MQLIKLITAAFCLLLTCNFSFAQTDGTSWEKVHKNELSLNVKQAINVFFFPTIQQTDPYMLQYRRYIGDGALRAGFGATVYNTTNTQNEDTVELESNSSAFDIRVGYQLNEEIGKRFLFYYGADLFMSSTSSKYENLNSPFLGLTTTTGSSTSFGVAPLLGVQFYITPRVSLGTEANYRIASMSSKNETTYENQPERNRKDERSGITTEFWAPNSLYLNIRF